MPFRTILILLALSLAAAPATAQTVPVAGRWRVLVHPEDPGAESVRGELRLADSAGVLRGTLRLESDSGAPLPLSLARRPAPDSLELGRIAQGPLRLTGRWYGIAWRGEVTRAGREVGRWEAVELDEDEEFYPAQPTFTLRQLILGTPARAPTVPGPWLGAARATLGGDAAATLADRYAASARAAGAPVLGRQRIATDGERWLLGLTDRAAWRGALTGDLGRLRARLGGVPLARFDALFQPASGWVADLHDAALRAAHRRMPAAGWSDWSRGLVASGLAAPGADEAALMEAAWRLWSLGEADTAAFRLRLEAVRASEAGGAGVPALLLAYSQAAAWHLEATAFLAGLLAPDGATTGLGLEPFGAPGVAAEGALDSALAGRLVAPANWEAERWLARHGTAGLARAVGRLEPEYGEAAIVDLDRQRLSLTTPAAETRAGRLGAGGTIRYDPGEAPLLAAARVAMERERARLMSAWRAGPGSTPAAAMALLPDPEPHLAAGMAELAADRMAAGLPLLQAANDLRRALEAARDPATTAPLGHALVTALAEGLGHATLEATRAEVVALGYDWSAAAARPLLARAWSAWREVAAAVLPAGRGPVLVPELRFAVEGGEPQVVGIRIHALE